MFKTKSTSGKKLFFLKGLVFSLIIFFFLGTFILKVIKTKALLHLKFKEQLAFFLGIIYFIYYVLKIFRVFSPLPQKLQEIQEISVSGLLYENLEKRVNETAKREFFLSFFLNLIMLFIFFLSVQFVYSVFSRIRSMINSLRQKLNFFIQVFSLTYKRFYSF